ncbi:MAG: hypothetical protein MHPDNHAH_03496 [Anaerolineales bacterium]|nr:hypothetical protein [Anaerolineales bacterium]
MRTLEISALSVAKNAMLDTPCSRRLIGIYFESV